MNSAPLIAATAAHAEALALVHARSFPHSERWGATAMALQLELPGAFGWIAAQGGMILARVAADEAEILTFAVEPAARRQGLGQALLTRALETAARRRAASMVLEVAAGNTQARALYSKLGFREIGTRNRYYAGGADALVLRLALVEPNACGCVSE